MTLSKEFLDYPDRRYGMDHDRYSWSMLSERPKVIWPHNANLAIWINVCLQFFPIGQQNPPGKVPGGMMMPYPDLRHYTLRDYGNRIGIYRVLDALDRFAITPTFAMSTALAQRNRYLLDVIKDRNNEIIAHGLHMDALHVGGQDILEERQLVKQSTEQLRELSGQDITGWLSPARSESENTPELLAEHGIRYFCDWVNDDMPYSFNTQSGELMAMPLSNELEDQTILHNYLHSEDSYVEQISDACDFLLSEAIQTQSGRILALNIHPWILGQPHRISRLEAALEHITSKDGIWSASATEILAHFNRNKG